MAFLPVPPWLVWVVAHSAKQVHSKSATTCNNSPLLAAHAELVEPFKDEFWWFVAPSLFLSSLPA
jgi:hypothetical protein